MLPIAIIALAALYLSRQNSARSSPVVPSSSLAVDSSIANRFPHLRIPRFIQAPASCPVNHSGVGVLGVSYCQPTKAGQKALCAAEEKQCRLFHSRIAPAVRLGPTCGQQSQTLLNQALASGFCNPGGSSIDDFSNNFR